MIPHVNHPALPNAGSPRRPDGRDRRGLRGYVRDRGRFLLLAATSALASFALGALAAPYGASIASDLLTTLDTPRDAYEIVDDGTFREFWTKESGGARVRERSPDSPLSGSTIGSRIEFLDGGSLHEPVLWYGGRFQFMDVCPEWGCLAVQFGTDGEVAHAWPLRPDALEQAAHDAATGEFPHELDPGFSFVRDVTPFGISRYPNGDLLVTFFNDNGTSVPLTVGVARIDRRGYPVWFRRDYSRHWPHLEDDGSALVPGRSMGNGSIAIPIEGAGSAFTLDCPRADPSWDSVAVIDGDGRLLDRIDVMGAMLDSPFAPVLLDGSHPSGLRRRVPCNPLHTNYVHRVGGDAQDVWGVSPGDLVVSMRNVSAFAILDAGSGRVKRLVRGSFRRQHAVHHWQDSRFLLFDNQGGDGVYGPSRLLMVDLADGRETTIFPNAGTPEALRGLWSRSMGKISISPDRRRVLVVFTRAGVAVEVRLSDGAALRVFRSLHDVSGLEQFPEERATRPGVFMMTGLDYIDRPW